MRKSGIAIPKMGPRSTAVPSRAVAGAEDATPFTSMLPDNTESERPSGRGRGRFTYQTQGRQLGCVRGTLESTCLDNLSILMRVAKASGLTFTLCSSSRSQHLPNIIVFSKLPDASGAVRAKCSVEGCGWCGSLTAMYQHAVDKHQAKAALGGKRSIDQIVAQETSRFRKYCRRREVRLFSSFAMNLPNGVFVC